MLGILFDGVSSVSKAPEYGLKGEFWVAHGYALFWV